MEIVFLFYDNMTALDLVGPHEVLSHLPGAKVKHVASSPGPIRTSSGLVLIAEHKLSDVSHADILLIPGAGNATSLQKFPETLDWIRAIHATTTWTTSVCTGSLILGAAGILSGHRATTHWAVMDRLPTWGAKPTHARIVEDGKVMTAAGVSAGIEYDPDPPFDVGSPEKASPAIREALRARLHSIFEE